MLDKAALRKMLREARLSLTPDMIVSYSQKITDTLLTLTSFRQAIRIGCYLPMQNEVDLSSFIQQVWQMKKQSCLPVLNSLNEMDFYIYTPATELIKNKYGIDEPNRLTHQKINPEHLDLLLIPLVAFDAQGNRLGQGAGFYDRYLAHYQKTEKKPTTIGIGYELQKIDHLPIDKWDIPLDFIVSEKHVYSIHA